MEFGGYLLNVARTSTRARARKGEAQGVLSCQKVTSMFDNPHMKYMKIFDQKHQKHPIFLQQLLTITDSRLCPSTVKSSVP